MKISKKIIIGGVIVLFFVVVLMAIKLLSKTEKEKWELLDVPQYENVVNYQIKKEEDGKLIINENVQLKLRVPEDWEIIKATEGGDGQTQEIRIVSPDLERDENALFSRSGCEMGVFVRINPSLFLDDDNFSEEKETINEKLFIKKTLYEDSEKGSYILAKTFANDKEYNFVVLTPVKENEKDRCLKEFQKMLESVSIKQVV